MDILVKTLAGLESLLAEELRNLGARQITPLTRAVGCTGDQKLLYRINLEARTALRVLTPLHRFQASNERQLYRGVDSLDWSAIMGLRDTLAVDAVVRSSLFTHSHYVALKTKDAIVDQFRKRTGRRPSVDTDRPTHRINIHLWQDQVTIALDSSGSSLHRRGYRELSVEAPINEVLAAGILLLTGWAGDQPLVDPMCGSGTFPIEAALLARSIPPQWLRQNFGFMTWRHFDPRLWRAVRAEAEARILPQAPAPIFAFDKDMRAIRATRRNAARAGVDADIAIRRRPFERLEAPAPQGLLVMNPPYDERLEVEDVQQFYKGLGDQLKKNFPGYTAWVLSSHREALAQIGLRHRSSRQLFNGALACKLLEYDLYEGSKR